MFIRDRYDDLRLCILPPGRAADVVTCEPASSTSSSSDSEDDGPASSNLMAEVCILTSKLRRYVDLKETHQPAHVSHMVAMVCDNCFDDHAPEDYIVDDYVSDYSLSSANLVSMSEIEDG